MTLSGSQSETIYAKSGKIVNQNGVNYLILNNGKFLNNDNGIVTTFSFEKTEFNHFKIYNKNNCHSKNSRIKYIFDNKMFFFDKKTRKPVL